MEVAEKFAKGTLRVELENDPQKKFIRQRTSASVTPR